MLPHMHRTCMEYSGRVSFVPLSQEMDNTTHKPGLYVARFIASYSMATGPLILDATPLDHTTNQAHSATLPSFPEIEIGLKPKRGQANRQSMNTLQPAVPPLGRFLTINTSVYSPFSFFTSSSSLITSHRHTSYQQSESSQQSPLPAQPAFITSSHP